MNKWIDLTVAFGVGLGLGTMFFVGLWITVQKAVQSSLPALWIFGSFVFRIGLVLLGFYYVGVGSWQKLLICVSGFLLARVVVTHFTKPKKTAIVKSGKEVAHEA